MINGIGGHINFLLSGWETASEKPLRFFANNIICYCDLDVALNHVSLIQIHYHHPMALFF